jgi:hypothetical protein
MHNLLRKITETLSLLLFIIFCTIVSREYQYCVVTIPRYSQFEIVSDLLSAKQQTELQCICIYAKTIPWLKYPAIFTTPREPGTKNFLPLKLHCTLAVNKTPQNSILHHLTVQ